MPIRLFVGTYWYYIHQRYAHLIIYWDVLVLYSSEICPFAYLLGRIDTIFTRIRHAHLRICWDVLVLYSLVICPFAYLFGRIGTNIFIRDMLKCVILRTFWYPVHFRYAYLHVCLELTIPYFRGIFLNIATGVLVPYSPGTYPTVYLLVRSAMRTCVYARM